MLSQPQNFSASIGSFQGLPAGTSEVILVSQRLALKYNTTPRCSCQHFLTSFFQIICGGSELPQSKPTALPAPSEREPLAYPQTLYFSRKLYRHAKGPILEDDFPRSGGRCRAATKRGICRRRRLGEYPQMPSRENEIAERPQTLRYLEIKNNFSADYAQSARDGHSKSSPTAPPSPSASPFVSR